MDFLITAQRAIYRSISGDLSSFAATHDWMALAAVLPLGVVFGAVHALTPGHGKTVLSAYVAGARIAALRALGVAGALALTHVGTAVLLALVAAPIVTMTLGGAGRAPILENISRGLLLVVGMWFVVRAARGRVHQHREGIAVGIIAGLVPCPLTLFVMFFALARGVPEAGLTFAVAMMAGIALTLSGVALLTVLARDWMVAFADRRGASIDKIARVLEGATGAVLIAIGVRSFWS